VAGTTFPCSGSSSPPPPPPIPYVLPGLCRCRTSLDCAFLSLFCANSKLSLVSGQPPVDYVIGDPHFLCAFATQLISITPSISVVQRASKPGLFLFTFPSSLLFFFAFLPPHWFLLPPKVRCFSHPCLECSLPNLGSLEPKPSFLRPFYSSFPKFTFVTSDVLNFLSHDNY